MTVAAQPQFSAPFPREFSGSIAGTFGAIAGATPGSAPAGRRPGKLPGRLAGKLTGKWPFRPAPQDQVPAGRGAEGAVGDTARPAPASSPAIPAGNPARGGEVSVREMVTDILLVGMWGAMIPGLMWLGAALGF
ncbi:hypothetical protein [Achromobacter aloeverae]